MLKMERESLNGGVWVVAGHGRKCKWWSLAMEQSQGAGLLRSERKKKRKTKQQGGSTGEEDEAVR